ncbi:hypothetical protein [Laspinema olomoucense]|uniref:Uncharacterized protein n=1 Tax=Laspinema olomoucense D3b TaxID=2953688 RepID=A0ABT2N4M1_9CYAN|nr:hypothetical protein [Laspinema sp. D3b]MCT7977632.1 hypothetical protein [Laspinema sp. D3b]
MASNIIAKADFTFGAALAVHELNLSTGSGARAISGIHRHFGISSSELPGTEGSFAEYSDLQPGIYQVNVWLESQERSAGSRDVLYAFNQADVVEITDTTPLIGQNTGGLYETAPAITEVVEVPYGELSIILVNDSTTTGTTIAHVTELQRIGDLPYPVPIVYSNQPDNFIGSAGYNEPYGWANTGTGDRAASTLNSFLGFSDPVIQQGAQDAEGWLIPTNGSLIQYNVVPGVYRIIWELISSESEPTRDGFFIWNGSELSVGGRRSLCTNQVTTTRFSSGRITTELSVFGPLAFIAVDTETTSGTTEIRIHRLEKIGEITGMIIFPAHYQLLSHPLNLATTALNSYRHSELNLTNTQTLPQPEPYLLESWEQWWWPGYNWRWHHMNPDGQDDSTLNQEMQDFSFPTAWNNSEFKTEFLTLASDAGLKTLAIFNYTPTPALSSNSTDEFLAFQVIRGLYRLAGVIGEQNNINPSPILDQLIPTANAGLTQFFSEIVANNPASIAAIAHVFTRMSQGYLPPVFLDSVNYTELYQRWTQSWGLD